MVDSESKMGGTVKMHREVREPSTAVVEAVAEHDGVDPLELPPLYDAVDPVALDSLFATGPDGWVREGHLRFTFAGYEVTVHTSGEIELRPDDAPGTSGRPQRSGAP